MKPRFPLSHRACYQRPKKETTRERTDKEGGLPTAVINQKPETDPAVSNGRDPRIASGILLPSVGRCLINIATVDEVGGRMGWGDESAWPLETN